MRLSVLTWMAMAAVFAVAGAVCADDRSGRTDWPGYLGGDDRNHYSALDQINRSNVAELEVAWMYHTGDAEPEGRSQIQCNPLVINGVLYASSPRSKFFALNAATGAPLWTFDPLAEGGSAGGGAVNRGLAYWVNGADRRIFAGAGSRLYALDAATGQPIASFGEKGSIDLHLGLPDWAQKLYAVITSPAVVYKDLLIVGVRMNEAHPSAPGDVRAFNVRTGALAWSFHTIPHPGEPGYETWPADAWEHFGGANCWAGMALDAERGVVYVPTGSAAYDFYGADRPGANLYANSLLALDAATGQRKWHYQMVHHDLWDRDLPAPPNLFTLERDGRRIPAVAQITKSARVFVFNRETGEPLHPIEEQPFPASDLPGEATWPTQPVPVRPPAFGRQAMTEAEVTDISEASHTAVLDRFKRTRSAGQFIPPSREGTIIFPGFDGGGEWGGAAVDPHGILYVNASEMPWILQMVDLSEQGGATRSARMHYARHCLYCHGVQRQGDPIGEYPPLVELGRRMSRDDIRTMLRDGKGKMPSFQHLPEAQVEELITYLLAPVTAGAPAQKSESGAAAPQFSHTGYNRFLDPEGYPAVKPPWGTLAAIDLNKGEIKWQRTLGEVPELSARGLPPTGTENYGGPVVTAGGLIFIAATKDEKIRAIAADTGERLWETSLPAGGYATPATYAVGGRQYLVIAAGGGKMGTKSGDAYVAFALRESAR
jgi:quinoprotein glucose dehydrogenase